MTEMSRALNSKWGLIIAFTLMVLSLSVAGCSSAEPTGVLTGSVKSDGETCGNCLVSIADPKTLVRCGCIVDESGTYELKDIPFGEYQVRVVQRASNSPVNVYDERIPKKYSDVKTSGITASITSQEPVVLNIDLE